MSKINWCIFGSFVLGCMAILEVVALNKEEDQSRHRSRRSPDRQPGNKKVVSICQDNMLKLDCQGCKKISITRAIYGRSGTEYCNSPSDPDVRSNCTSEGTLQKVKGMCQGKNECTLNAKNEYYGDPCPNSTNYLEVTYYCRQHSIVGPLCNVYQVSVHVKHRSKVAKLKEINSGVKAKAYHLTSLLYTSDKGMSKCYHLNPSLTSCQSRDPPKKDPRGYLCINMIDYTIETTTEFKGTKGSILEYQLEVTGMNEDVKNKTMCRIQFKVVDKNSTITQEHCPSGPAKGETSQIMLYWPTTTVGQTANVSCKDESGGVAKRLCKQESENKTKWDAVDDSSCFSHQKVRAKAINKLANKTISAANATVVSGLISKLTRSDPSSISSAELIDVANVLENLKPFVKGNKQVPNDMIDIVENILHADREAFWAGQRASNTSSRLLSVLGNIGVASLSEATPNIYFTRNGFALTAVRENASNFKGISIRYKNSTQLITMPTSTGKDSLPKYANDTSIYLPSSISRNKNTLDLVFLGYNNTKLFYERGSMNVYRHVISAVVNGHNMKNLTEPIVAVFDTKGLNKDEEVQCYWWDFSKFHGLGGWSMEGCILHKQESEIAICHCYHLTNFAVLLGAKEVSRKDEIYLSIVTYIGCGLSLAGALLTLTTYAIFPNLRDSNPPKILMNLCCAYILLLIVFIVGAERTESEIGCQTVAAFIHYFLLCVFSWSAIEGFTSFRGLVLPMVADIHKFMWKAMLVGWGVPLVFVIAGLAAWSEHYGRGKSCVVKELPLYVTVIPPIVLVILGNSLFLIIIVLTLNKSSQRYKHNAFSKRVQLRIIVAFVLLFGLTWMFGFLVVSNNIIAFQYVFCSLSTLQGFFIFLFYCIRNENARKSWSDVFHLRFSTICISSTLPKISPRHKDTLETECPQITPNPV